MPEREADIFHREILKKTSNEFEDVFLRRLQEEGRLALTNPNLDYYLQIIRNRIAEPFPTASGKIIAYEKKVETEAKKLLRVAEKKLKNLSNEDREKLRLILLEREGYDLRTGKEKEFGIAEGDESIGINIHTLEFLRNKIRGRHEAVVGKLAQKTINRAPGVYPDDIPSAGYRAEKEIMYGVISHSVAGWDVPLARLHLNLKTREYTNRYMNHPQLIEDQVVGKIKRLLINELFVLPMDRFCRPLKV